MKVVLSVVLAGLIPTLALAAPNRIELASGYSPGQFSVSIFTPKDGALAPVLKYMTALGVVSQNFAFGTLYNLKNDKDAGTLIDSTVNTDYDSTGGEYYQLNLKLNYDDLLQLKASAAQKAAAYIQFRGALANDLYNGMEKSGLKAVGQSLDQQGHAVGNIYEDGDLCCDKLLSRKTGSLEVWCSLTLLN